MLKLINKYKNKVIKDSLYLLLEKRLLAYLANFSNILLILLLYYTYS